MQGVDLVCIGYDAFRAAKFRTGEQRLGIYSSEA